jgi:uncharacterized protein YoxC
MIEIIEELKKRLKEVSSTSTNLIKAIDALALVKFEDTEKKRSMIDDIRQMYHKVEEERQKVIDAISALQEVCTHTDADGKSAFRDSGHNSHYSYEKCELCGYEGRC